MSETAPGGMMYVVSRNGGCEGYGGLFLIFTSKVTAFAWCHAMADEWDVFEVPVYPSVPSEPWFAQKPLVAPPHV